MQTHYFDALAARKMLPAATRSKKKKNLFRHIAPSAKIGFNFILIFLQIKMAIYGFASAHPTALCASLGLSIKTNKWAWSIYLRCRCTRIIKGKWWWNLWLFYALHWHLKTEKNNYWNIYNVLWAHWWCYFHSLRTIGKKFTMPCGWRPAYCEQISF